MEWFSSAFLRALSPHLGEFTKKGKCCQKVPRSGRLAVNLETPSRRGWVDVLVQSLLVSLFQVQTSVPSRGGLLMGTQLEQLCRPIPASSDFRGEAVV